MASNVSSWAQFVSSWAQSPVAQPKPVFEVASIWPAAIDTPGGEGGTRAQIQPAPDGLTLRNIDLSEMIEWAYGLQHSQVSGPAFLQNHRYDVRARAGEPVSDKTLRLMLQSLLAVRFDLKLHREQRMTSVYELVIAKNGPKLPPNKADSLPASYPRETFPRVVDGDFVFTNVTMSDFAQQLTELRGIDLPVVDRTSIPGVYDITLKSAARDARAGRSIASHADSRTTGTQIGRSKEPDRGGCRRPRARSIGELTA